MMTKLFGKKKDKKTFDGTDYPNSSEANEWMSNKLAHYKKYKPDDAHVLFSPASGDYLPKSVYVGSSWKKEHEEHYRNLKKEHPKLVSRAKEMTHGLAGRVSKSTVGDSEDFK